MFACIHASGNLPILLDCARQFSPLIEITSDDTVTFDIRGLSRLHGSSERIANEILCLVGIPANIAIAANPDAAIHAARGIPGITIIPPGMEAEILAPLSLHLLHCPAEMGELLDLWGIRTFGQFAALPPLGVVARLGEEGTRWQRITQGSHQRQLRLVNEQLRFEKEMEIEEEVSHLEPLLFLVSRLLHELCDQLTHHSLATNEVRLRLQLEKESEHLITLRLPVPMSDQTVLLKLLQLDLSERPPSAAITKLYLEMQPVPPRSTQEHLFTPAYPSAEKLEVTIARVRLLVGEENIGSPRVLDTHQPDGFVMEPFHPEIHLQNQSTNKPVRFAFRRFRPPQPARVKVNDQPVYITSPAARGEIRIARGPWFTSGHWWRTDVWTREEWDIALRDGALYRIFRDLVTAAWFVEGNYD